MKEKTIGSERRFWFGILFACLMLMMLAFAGIESVHAQGSQDWLNSEDPDGHEECLACHSQPNQSLTLPSGEILMTTINDADYALSVHGSQGFKCTNCHQDYAGYPHPERTTQDLREYTIEHEQICIQCHQGQYQQLEDSVHFEILEGGNKYAPVCSDCHNPHAQSDWGQSPLELELALTSQVCAQCHNSIFVEYAQSVHGLGLFHEHNMDVPTCETCHGIHSIEDPRTAEARLNSPALCADCHTNPAIMDKYGLSTDVLSTYIADFHGTTVTLFEKISPDQPTNKPVCYDCHGVHDISAVDDPEKGIQIKENLLITCQRCHPDATINLPDSWMSHYIPSPEHYPLVYYVQQFYKVLIPVVLGGMALFIATDIWRRFWNMLRGKYAHHSSSDDNKDAK